MRIVVIGGSGHVGTYMIPRLVDAGHEVIVVTRGQRDPYQPHHAWASVQRVTIDRAAEEARGEFGMRIRALVPDVVIDMICFTLPSAQQLVEALRGHVQHFLHCGTIWVHGYAVETPTTEAAPRRPFASTAAEAEIEAYLLREAAQKGFPATCCIQGISSGRAGRAEPGGALQPGGV